MTAANEQQRISDPVAGSKMLVERFAEAERLRLERAHMAEALDRALTPAAVSVPAAARDTAPGISAGAAET